MKRRAVVPILNKESKGMHIPGFWENLPTTKPLVWAFFLIHMGLTIAGWKYERDLPVELGLILRTCAPVLYAGYFGKSVAEHIKNRQFDLEEREVELQYDYRCRQENADCDNH